MYSFVLACVFGLAFASNVLLLHCTYFITFYVSSFIVCVFYVSLDCMTNDKVKIDRELVH